MTQPSWGVRIDRMLAVPMFLVSLTFLGLLAFGLEGWWPGWKARFDTHFCWVALAWLYPLFFIEPILHAAAGSPWKKNLLYALLPPLRIGGRDHTPERQIWLPLLGWRRVDARLQAEVEQLLSVPMIVIALTILPILVAEHIWKDRLYQHPILAVVLFGGTALIWLAFTIEFVLMISIVEKKLKYCREHWVDLAIILMPLAAFLRIARLGRLARLEQVGRLSRVYRLRGVTMRMYRAVLVLNVLRRLFPGSTEKQLAVLREQLREKRAEAELIEARIVELEEKMAATAPPRISPAISPQTSRPGGISEE